MPSPSVTVIIPTHNAATTVAACIRSALSAEYDGPREIIVVDDASTDSTCAIVESLDCRLIRKEQNHGPAVARNAGAKAASGEVLIFIDSDTEMRPDAIHEAVEALYEDGVHAVTGMYEPEPLNSGFFPAYYSYLKYHAFTANPVRRIQAFGAQCAAIRKSTFEQVGGFRPFPWGVDIENDELGFRINRHGPVVLARKFRVGHNFPEFRKLLRVFTGRVYWYILFIHQCRKAETVLMTRGLGTATAAFPAAGLALLLMLVLPADPARALLMALAGLGLAVFAWGYWGLWRLCRKRRGWGFALAAAGASAFFSVVISASAAWAHLTIAWSRLRRDKAPLVQPAMEQA